MRPIRNIATLFLSSISGLFCSGSFAQQAGMEFKPGMYRVVPWTVQDGLPDNQSNTMLKDTRGYLWIGSGISGGGELCRFDGAGFKKYSPDRNKRGSINTSDITAFTEDSLNNIWITTEKGVSWYDYRADTFKNFLPFIDTASPPFRIVPFWATKDEVFCIEPGGVITTINIHTLVRKELLHVSKKDDPGTNINSNKFFFEKSSNSIWTFLDGVYGKMQQIFLDGRTPTYYTWPCYNKAKHKHTPGSQSRHAAEDIKYDPKRNAVWINSGEGLLRFSLADKQFYRIDAWNQLTGLKDYDRGVGIDIDKDGRVWFSTFAMGIFIYDPETDQLRQFFSETDPQQEAGKYNLHIYCDRDGIVWTSNWSNKGIYELVPYNSTFKQYNPNPRFKDSLSSGQIISIVPGPQGKVWLGTTDGLNIFDPHTEKFLVLREKDLPGIRGNTIVPLHIDTLKQKAWLAVSVSPFSLQKYFGMDMYEMDLKTRKCQPVIFRDSIKRLSESYAEPYLVAPYKNGLLVWNNTHQLGLFEIKENSLFADRVYPSTMGVSGWVLKDDRLVFLRKWQQEFNTTLENKNGIWIKSPHPLDSLTWQNMIFNDKDQTWWVSFSSELVQYNRDFHIIKSYTEKDGYHGTVSKFLADKKGNIWFANLAREICTISPATGNIITFTQEDGYQKQDFQWNACGAKDAWGNLYFGMGYQNPGNEALTRIYPESYSFSGTASVYLRMLSVSQKSFPLFTVADNLKQLDLQYDQNTIKIETRNIDFYSKSKGHLRFRLERNGKQEDWQYGQANQSIFFEGLPPGSYRLVMQAAVFGKEFNGPEKILTINISPPFWQTWWFRTLAAVVVITGIYGIIQYRSRSLKQRNKELEEKVFVRTKELKHSLKELKETQTQLIQSEKMASLGELTAGIAHEIQNPLNFVNNFSEVSRELLDELYIERSKVKSARDEELEKNILQDVSQNLEKIIHHGKRADAIVKGMLQHSLTSSGQKELIDINALADEYLRLAFNAVRAKDKDFNATLNTSFDEKIGKIDIVPQDIGRVLLNLYNNAFYALSAKAKTFSENKSGGDALAKVYEKQKFPIPGFEPTVNVSTQKNDSHIIITVKDNGTGIDPAHIDKIFQPFFTTKPTGQGTGLGLSLVYDILKTHGGSIKVDSKPGIETTFTIQLPNK